MASRYNLVDYDSDEEAERYPVVPLANLLSATVFMATLFDQAGIPYGVMGGFAVKLMGGTRDTRDVDIAFQAKMGDLWKLVENESRLTIPNTKLLSNIMKAFVNTGPGYDECAVAVPVEVDLIENGYQNSPRDLVSNRQQLVINLASGPTRIYSISRLHLLRGKMAAFMSRGRENDMRDIRHLVHKYEQELPGFVSHLDPDAISCVMEASPDLSTFFGR